MVHIEKTSDGVGALVSGIDVRAISAAEQEQLDQAWAEHGVLFMHDQQLEPEDHLEFATRFAPVDVNKFFAAVEGHPEIAQVLKEPDQTANIGGGWHTDHSYDREPARGSVLVAREVPPSGGDTMFADVAAAYEALSPGLRETLEGLRAVHTNEDVFGRGSKHAAQRGGRIGNPDATSTVEHPVVVRHPQTGRKLLYVNPGFTRQFVGWTREESKPLLKYLFEHIGDERFTTRFSWRPGSIAMWDNRSTWHWALNDYDGHRRLMHRVTIRGVELSAAS